ncbi:hypothetical protein HNQ91_003004 [Filimonas zeae]|uniref:Uncharacterized protein n=1 Tax=Filimonas zeae TaxID=1737353 RepID=A0A917IZ06_9BACT|nr:hypothetical protein [Filimonas zeae]MDR6339939.1 hypothetical protein [Filimonas zeae]GGH70381.1 hypothetical protein GCM10011379_28600 [Filimonas zeae]
MDKRKSDVDVIEKVLDTCYRARPDALFFMSLLHQYEERGSLSKKQLEGLLAKARKIEEIPSGWLATLEAVILKMPTRFKSTIPVPAPVVEKDERPGQLIANILAKYPQHKRVLFLKAKYDNNEPLSALETGELEKFSKLLLKQ